MITDTMVFSRTGEPLSALTDAQILARAGADPDLFAVLVRRYEPAFLRRARSILKDPEDAREVVQDAFVKIYLYADRYHEREGASFASWAYTILNRVAYTRYTARRGERERRADLLPEQYESLPDSAAEFLAPLSLRNEVLAVLAVLPESAARILRLQFLEGKSQTDIARKEGLSIAAVKTRVLRAKRLFKKAHDAQNKTP